MEDLMAFLDSGKAVCFFILNESKSPSNLRISNEQNKLGFGQIQLILHYESNPKTVEIKVLYLLGISQMSCKLLIEKYKFRSCLFFKNFYLEQINNEGLTKLEDFKFKANNPQIVFDLIMLKASKLVSKKDVKLYELIQLI